MHILFLGRNSQMHQKMMSTVEGQGTLMTLKQYQKKESH